MGIKIKNKKPTLNEFSSKDLIVNPQENKLFFKGKDKVVEVGSGLPGQWVKRDNNNIFYRSGSAQVLDDGTNNYIIELEAASGGPRINFGAHDSNNDAFMVLGAFDNINLNRHSLFDSIPNFITKSKNIYENKSTNQINLFVEKRKRLSLIWY